MSMIHDYPARFVVTDSISEEITSAYPDQQTRYERAIKASILEKELATDPKEHDYFLRLGRMTRLGSGERSAIAIAVHRNYAIAMDDRRAINKALQEAKLNDVGLSIIRTEDIIRKLIQLGRLDVPTADAILHEWASNHNFKLKISSFSNDVP